MYCKLKIAVESMIDDIDVSELQRAKFEAMSEQEMSTESQSYGLHDNAQFEESIANTGQN